MHPTNKEPIAHVLHRSALERNESHSGGQIMWFAKYPRNDPVNLHSQAFSNGNYLYL